MNITFLHFDVECEYESDWLYIDNFSKHCGKISKPWSFISNNHTINLTFMANSYGESIGFLAVWSPTTEPPTYPSIGCDNCDFPFKFGDSTFNTCISVLDVDTQPWCSYDLIPPSSEGIHKFSLKITCSDSDSSCPNSAPQMLITSPDYLDSYPNNADQVYIYGIDQ